MTIRSLSIGIMLGLAVAATTYFNDAVIRQTMLIGNYLPLSVFGVVLLLAIVIGPLLGRVRASWSFGAGEIAVILAVALAACSWSGSNYWRYFSQLMVMPAELAKTRTGWLAQEVMSYVPGGSGRVAPGQIVDHRALAARIIADGQQQPDSPPGRVWVLGDDADRSLWNEVARTHNPTPRQRSAVARALNDALTSPDFLVLGNPADTGVGPSVSHDNQTGSAPAAASTFEQTRRHRLVLQQALPDLILPMPQGSGVLIADGRADHPAALRLLSGSSKRQVADWSAIPWDLWNPVLWRWGGLALLAGLAAWCMAVIVHPQWTRNELLAYPITLFVRDLADRSPGRAMPSIFTQRLFWIALALALLVHLTNGLHRWEPSLPRIPLQIDLAPLRTLFPNASKVPGIGAYLWPQFYLSVIAFGFFLTRTVSLSLGISQLLYIIVGAILIGYGVPITYAKSEPNVTNFLRLGTFAGMTLMILYFGRRYYLDVLLSAAGLRRSHAAPPYAVHAARLLVLLGAASVGWLMQAGMSPWLALATLALAAMIWLVFARIVAETGLFFLTGPFLPIAVLLGWFGFEAMGPTGSLLAGIAGFILVGDPREAVMPFMVSSLSVADGVGRTDPPTSPTNPGWNRPGVTRLLIPTALMLLLSFAAAAYVTLGIQHGSGMNRNDWAAMNRAPREAFDTVVSRLAEAEAYRTGSEAVGQAGGLTRIAPSAQALSCTAIGMALVVGLAVARMRLPWWPLHPVVALLWGTYTLQCISASILLGWAAKTAAMRLGGVGAYHRLKPLMVGLIAGELAAALLWSGVGALYYFLTGVAPTPYEVFPR